MLINPIDILILIAISLASTRSKFVFKSLDRLKVNDTNKVLANNENAIESKPITKDKSDKPVIYWPADNNPVQHTKPRKKEPVNLDPDRILYTADSLGNPFTTPEKCVRISDDSVFLCDPDNILSEKHQYQINSKLKQLHNKNFYYCPDGHQYGLKIALLLVKNIFVPFPKSLDETGRWLSQELIDKWKIGNKDCNNGVVLLYVKNNNALFVSVKDSSQALLSPEKIGSLQDDFIDNLKTTNDDYESLSNLLDNLGIALSGKKKDTKWFIIIPCVIVLLYLMAVGLVYTFRQ